ncbi:uncharacterized protein LOC118447214 isoform X3 [Vespa mandarinia]|uniref:uncharacterized protein LOC118447214 isoform X3 n=1 Tax=Vespa mandarinia TaxID=7446 RepID=UPI00161AD990|nr:uncharacterized protein LOC118447214 isoform X3 [Vespa mandarinia]
MDCPALINIFHTPKIIWYQTDNTIGIRVMLQDVKDYFLRVEIDHLFFSVIPEKTTHLNLEREIKINLIKAFKWLPWLRLLNDKEKFPYVVHDLERLYEPSWRKDEKRKIVIDEEHKIAEYLRTQNILPDDEYTNDEDSDEWLDNEMLDDLLF